MRCLFPVICCLILLSCKKDPVAVLPTTVTSAAYVNNVNVRITNMAGNAIIQLAPDSCYTGITPKYLNANNDTFSVTKLRYYISNVKLKRNDGTFYIEPESYHLVDLADSANLCNFTVNKVPIGNYIGIDFMIGVDSTRNCSGAQGGALDPSNDMFWDWNQGYIFFKFEGYSSSAPASGIHNLAFHVGGFKAPYNNIKSVSLLFPSNTLLVDADHSSKIYLKADLLEAFSNPTLIDFSVTTTATSPQLTRRIAGNYLDMFKVAAVVH